LYTLVDTNELMEGCVIRFDVVKIERWFKPATRVNRKKIKMNKNDVSTLIKYILSQVRQHSTHIPAGPRSQ
jgi:hypothetical protein